jgi:hypothetical protein
MIQRWLYTSRLGVASLGTVLILLAETAALGAAEPTTAELKAQGRCEAKATERGMSDKASQRFVSRCTSRAVVRKADRVAERKAKRQADRAARSAGPLPEQPSPTADDAELE